MDTGLREFTSPLLVEPTGYTSLVDVLAARCEEAPDHIAFQRPLTLDARGAMRWKNVTTREFYDDVEKLAAHFIAAGIQPGDAIAVMGPTCYEWVLSDIAALWAGAVVVPVYHTSAPAQVRAVVADAGVVRAVGGSRDNAEVLADALGDSDLVWMMEDDPEHRFQSLGSLLAQAPSAPVSEAELRERCSSRTLEDVATIVYTSGTTSEPKGVQLTHGNFVMQILNIGYSHRNVLNEHGSTILFLPLSHVLARAVQLVCLAKGMRVAHLSDTSRVIPTFAEIRPTFVMVVPRVLEKILTAAGSKAEEKKLGKIWKDAVAVAERVGKEREKVNEFQMPPLPLGLKTKHALYDQIFYSKIRKLLGGNMIYVLCGGAKLHPDLAHAFSGFGIPVLEGYGLTETTAPLAANLPGDLKAGTVGPPVPGMTVKISADGELLAKGPGVSPGYRNPIHNEAAFVDGFLRTGDLAEIDAQGRITLKGRSKDVIVTSGGKTIEPAGWEGAVEKHPSVAYAVAVGDDRPYLTALLIQQMEAGEGEGDEVQIIENPKLIADLLPYIENANSDVSRTERIRKFALVRANLDDPNLMTPSMKLRRAAFLEKAKSAIDDLYEKVPARHIFEVGHKDGESERKPRRSP